MHHLHERATPTRLGLFLCPLVPPLTKEFPRSIENPYAAVAIAIGNVDVSIDGIHRARHSEEQIHRTVMALAEALGRMTPLALKTVADANFAGLRGGVSHVAV